LLLLLLPQAFPSGHASNSMSVAWFTVLYLVWSLYLRSDAPYPRRLYWGSNFWGRMLGEVRTRKLLLRCDACIRSFSEE
jgi:membrane-associated phospholipid phosphatase